MSLHGRRNERQVVRSPSANRAVSAGGIEDIVVDREGRDPILMSRMDNLGLCDVFGVRGEFPEFNCIISRSAKEIRVLDRTQSIDTVIMRRVELHFEIEGGDVECIDVMISRSAENISRRGKKRKDPAFVMTGNAFHLFERRQIPDFD